MADSTLPPTILHELPGYDTMNPAVMKLLPSLADAMKDIAFGEITIIMQAGVPIRLETLTKVSLSK